MWRKTRNCSSIIAALFLIAASGTFFSSSSVAQERKTIHISYSALSLAFLPHLVARDAKIFQKHGLDVDFIQMAGPLPIAALVAGDLDFGAAFSTALIAAAKGLPIRGVMVTVKAPPFYIIADPNVNKLDDLVGKKVGVDRVGSLQHTAANVILKKNGIAVDKITYVQTGSVSNTVAAMSGKAISAALLSAPWNVVMTQKGFRQLANAQEAGIIYPPGGLAVQSSKLQKERLRVRQVINVLSDALKFIEEDKPWVVGYIQKTWKLNPAAAEDAYRQTLPLLVMNGKLGFDEVQSFLDSAYDNKEISERADGKQLVDYSILDEVIKERRR